MAASFGGPAIFLINQYVVFPRFVPAGPSTIYLVIFASIGATMALWIASSLVFRRGFRSFIGEHEHVDIPTTAALRR